MRLFTELYLRLDRTTRVLEKLAALERYFAGAPPEDAAWAVSILTGQRVLRVISGPRLRDAAAARTRYPAWLVDECYSAVGDLSETIALLLPPPAAPVEMPLHRVYEELILPMGAAAAPDADRTLNRAWDLLTTEQRLVFHKLVSGTFRFGVQRRLVVRALAAVAGVEPGVMEHRVSGRFDPTAAWFTALMSREPGPADAARPYPFCFAHALDEPPETLGDAAAWIAEWKWDGLRAQLIRRAGMSFLWSRGEESIAGQFPEVAALGRHLPDGTVLDGEILAWRTRPRDEPLPFQELQTRIGRKDVQPGLFDDTGIVFMAFDLLETRGADIRERPLAERRALLEDLVAPLTRRALPIRLSPVAAARSWEAIRAARDEAARTRAAEGLMLKRRDSRYHVGRTRGSPETGPGWWKWKVEPHAVDAVLVAAQPGSGRRAGLYTDYTFAVWDGPRLVPFAKAYSGLTDEEIRRVDRFVRRNTVEKHGPVRTVAPELVFEIGFQQIQASRRHRSGVAVRFPRILRWRPDKRPQDADRLESLLALLRRG